MPSSVSLAARAALEQATHRLVIKRQLPPPFDSARIYASSEGGLRYLRFRLRRVDPALLRLAGELVRPGHIVWDIGANLGLFSFAAAVAAGPSGRVLSVEPDAVLATLLRRSASSNRGCASVDVLPTAVCDANGIAQFHIARRNRSTSHLDGYGTNQTGGIRSTELVPAVTLDWLAAHFPLPNVVKVDVEEAEARVLAGGQAVLSARPVIICEVANRNSEVVTDLLTAYGYKLYDGDKPSAQRRSIPAAPHSTIAIYASRHSAT